MSPEKPKTPPERVEKFDTVYEIIPGSEDIPDTETTFGGPALYAQWPGSMGFAVGKLQHLHTCSWLHHRRGSRGVELSLYNSFDVLLVKSSAATFHSNFRS